MCKNVGQSAQNKGKKPQKSALLSADIEQKTSYMPRMTHFRQRASQAAAQK